MKDKFSMFKIQQYFCKALYTWINYINDKICIWLGS